MSCRERAAASTVSGMSMNVKRSQPAGVSASIALTTNCRKSAPDQLMSNLRSLCSSTCCRSTKGSPAMVRNADGSAATFSRARS